MSLIPRASAQSSIDNVDFLRQQARWIRDDLDPQVARDGPDILHSDDILDLDELLRRLIGSPLSLDCIRHSQLHLAICAISGQATRWPKKLIEKSDVLRATWEERFGPLMTLAPPLYEPGGRLYGICRPDDLSKEKLVVRWLRAPNVPLSPLTARKVGDLGFQPGDWWINALFAFRAGIIDCSEATAGIVCDSKAAYAILMAENEEKDSPTPETFTYVARSHDVGRYRLTAATRESRQPIRVLRSHTLRSFWSPRAGVRYKVIAWSVRPDAKTKEPVYEITLRRLASEAGMESVLRRPFSDEVEDYKEYKRLRKVARMRQLEAALAGRNGRSSTGAALTPTVVVSSDGVVEGDGTEVGGSGSEYELSESFSSECDLL